MVKNLKDFKDLFLHRLPINRVFFNCMKISAYLNEFATKIHYFMELKQFQEVLGRKSIKDFQNRMSFFKHCFQIFIIDE